MSSKKRPTITNEEAGPALVPKLRFPEFQGDEGWTPELMGDVYLFKGNNSLSREKLNYVTGSVRNVHYGDIHTKFSSHFDIKKELVPFINESEEGMVRDDHLCTEGDMIFADASEDMADIGKSIEIVSLNGEIVASGLHTILARRSGDRIVLGFGGHLFKSGWVRTQIQKEAQGAKVLGISANRMRNIRLPVPNSKAEQQKIAECLSSLDELIAVQARKVDALKTHKKGLMQQLFPREGETQPRLRFPEFRDAGEWRRETLGSLCARIMDGTHFSPKSKEGPRPYLTSKNIKDGRIDLSNLSYISEEEHTEIYNKCPVKHRDVLLTKDGANTGNCALNNLDFEFSLLSSVAVLRGQENKLCQDFLFQSILSDSIQSLITESMSGQAITRITLAKIGRFTISVTSPAEQQRIASCLSSLDALIAAETNKLEALKTHKKGLMQQLFPSPENH